MDHRARLDLERVVVVREHPGAVGKPGRVGDAHDLALAHGATPADDLVDDLDGPRLDRDIRTLATGEGGERQQRSDHHRARTATSKVTPGCGVYSSSPRWLNIIVELPATW